MEGVRRVTRAARIAWARVPVFGPVPDAPAIPVRDPWPGDAARGARLLRDEMEAWGAVWPLTAAQWGSTSGDPALRAAAHGFGWLRDLRMLGTDAARTRARQLVAGWIATRGLEGLAHRPDVAGARIAAWLGHYDFFAASADDAFRRALMGRLVTDTRLLAASLPGAEIDGRALTALKGLIAAGVALPDQGAALARGLRLLSPELTRQVLPDGCHAERSPAAQLLALQDLCEIRALLQAARCPAPPALLTAIERMAPALRALRHGDGGLVLFNGARDGIGRDADAALIELVLTQAGRGGRAPAGLTEGGFHRLQAGRTVLVLDGGPPPPPGLDHRAHAGTLSIELSVGRDRVLVNCGAAPVTARAGVDWSAAARSTAAHSTLVVADTNSSELRRHGLGRHPRKVEVQRQEANGAHWLEASHDGYAQPFGAVHRRRLYMAESGEDIRGEDAVEAASPQVYAVRFHVHPDVQATAQDDGESVTLRLPGGSTWRFRAEGAGVMVEESVYLGGPTPRPTVQIVLAATVDGLQQVKWALTKVG